MNTTEYQDMLPRPDCDPMDILEALTEKVPRFMRE